MSLLAEVIRSLFKKPSTVEYPKVSLSIEPDSRGVHYADLNKCVGCSLCMLNCPSQCISMENLPSGIQLKHNRKGIYPVVNYLSCVFCYRCVKVCPLGAFITTNVIQTVSVRSSKVLSRELSLSTLSER
ncbi:MAG: 4Fe-4S binding protein [Acidilobaceae archaeon]